MATFIPSYDTERPYAIKQAGDFAERDVLSALKVLDNDWIVFHKFTWRDDPERKKERSGEADVVVFHPDLGLMVIEVKGGGVALEKGRWYYLDPHDGKKRDEMKRSPFIQAESSRYYIFNKLKKTPISNSFLRETAITHAVWFPHITWTASIPPEAPGSEYLLDMRHLQDPGKYIKKLLIKSVPDPQPWKRPQIKHLMQTLAPEANLLPSMGKVIGDIKSELYRMTDGQIGALRALRTQKRLLIEGCAGSGKTLLAISLAREHLQKGKKVLFTCYNKFLAGRVSAELHDYEHLDAINFHELVMKLCTDHGIAYEIPHTYEEEVKFYDEKCPELLLDISQVVTNKYDTIIVDEAQDFMETWWISIESLAKEDFSFYVFYDLNQQIFRNKNKWTPPFKSEAYPLDRNLRNTKPIGEFARKIGKIKDSIEYGVVKGPKPETYTYKHASELPDILNKLIHKLINKDQLSADNVVVLSPHKYTNPKLIGLGSLVNGNADLFSTDILYKSRNKVRIGTIQACKGLEADVVILLGIDKACAPDILYVGASRARAMLYVIHHSDFKF